MVKQVVSHQGRMKLYSLQKQLIGLPETPIEEEINIIPVTGAFLEGDEEYYLSFNFLEKRHTLHLCFDYNIGKNSEYFVQPMLSKTTDTSYVLFGVFKHQENRWLAVATFEYPIHLGYPHFEDDLTMAFVHRLA